MANSATTVTLLERIRRGAAETPSPSLSLAMLKRILLSLLALLALFLLVGLALPQRYEVSRSAVIQAPAERVFPLFADLKNWPQWEPFSADDPTNTTTLGALTTGVGASQSWAGDGNRGRLTFTTCDPATGIEYDLVFTNGESDSPAKSWMHMTPQGGAAVELTWGMKGEMSFPLVGGYIALCADKFMGPMFADGLQNLKRCAEQPAPESK